MSSRGSDNEPSRERKVRHAASACSAQLDECMTALRDALNAEDSDHNRRLAVYCAAQVEEAAGAVGMVLR